MKGFRKEKMLASVTARLVMLVAAGLLLLSYLSVVVNPARAWLMSLFGLLFVPIALLNLLLLLWGLARKSSSFLIPLLALLPSVVYLGRYFQFSSGAEERADGCTRILTWNVGNFSMGRGAEAWSLAEREARLDSVKAILKANDPDIVCFQEMRIPGGKAVGDFLKENFPSYEASYFVNVLSDGSYGNVMLSRYPIVAKGRIDFEGSSNLAVYADLQIGDTKARIYNCHFESYSISLPRLVKSLGRDSTIVRETEHKMKRSIVRRPRQVQQVLSDIENCPVEAIVTGDFNDTPMSYTYRRLMKGRDDSFVKAGKGFGATYTVLWPLIRIDYVLYPSHYGAVSSRVIRKKFSDHYPVVAELNIR